MKFKFYLVKTVSWTPRYKELKKNLIIEAIDLIEARKLIYNNFPGWGVSMFWPV